MNSKLKSFHYFYRNIQKLIFKKTNMKKYTNNSNIFLVYLLLESKPLNMQKYMNNSNILLFYLLLKNKRPLTFIEIV